MKILKPFLSLLVLLFVVFFPCAADEPGAILHKEPHLLVDVSAALLSAVVQRSVDQTAPVEEVIQDTPIHGMGRTVGAIHAELVPDTRRAAVDLIFQGSVWSRTVGVRRTVRIHTVSTAPFDVRRRITVDEKGINVCEGPACAEQTTQLLNITSTMDFDEWSIRLAREFYRRSERDAQAESSFKTARKLANGMGDELAPTLAAASAALGKEVQSFKRGGLALEGLGFNTTSAFLQARLRFAIPERKQSDRILPLPADIDLGMRIHESAANEAAETEFAGRSFRLDGVSKVYDDLTRGLIRDGRKDSVQKAGLKKIEKALADLAGNPVNITFAKKDPVTVAFADQGFSVEFRIAAVQQEKTAYAGLRVMAAYRFENVASGVQAARIGPIQFFAEKAQPEKKLEALPAQYLFLLETLAAEVATERLILNPLPLPEALARLRLEPPRALAGDGWFALTWKLPARGKE